MALHRFCNSRRPVQSASRRRAGAALWRAAKAEGLAQSKTWRQFGCFVERGATQVNLLPAVANQLRARPVASKLQVMPAQNSSGQLNGQGKSQVPRWLRIVVIGRNPKVTLARAAVLAVLCFVVFKFILLPIRIDGISMLPAYQDGSTHFVNRLAYLWHEPRRGDAVSIRLAGPHVMYLKRIIGLPGETVAFVNGQVLINGQALDEPYEKSPCDWNLPPEELDANHYFVVGDNRTMPPENHLFGKVERARIIGKPIL